MSAFFRGTPVKMPNGWMVCGGTDEFGVVALIGFNGSPIWQNSYSIQGKKLTFIGIVKVGNKLFVSGSISIGTNRTDNILVQIDASGNLVRWTGAAPALKAALAFHSEYTRFGIKLMDLQNGQLMMCGWYTPPSSGDLGELFVINTGDGRLIQSANYSIGKDTQLYNGVASADPNRRFAYVMGTDEVGGSYKGLFSVIGYQSNFAQSRTTHLLDIKDSKLTEIFASLILPAKAHLIAGCYRTAQQPNNNTVFIAKITTDDENTNPTCVINQALAIRFGSEHKRIVKIVQVGDKFLITGFFITTLRSFVICLNNNLNIEWVKKVQTDTKSYLADVELFDNQNLLYSGYVGVENNWNSPALLYTDISLNSCKTETISVELVPAFSITPTTQGFTTFNIYPSDATYAKTYFPEITVSKLDIKHIALCPEKEFTFSTDEKMPQSPFLHLQAAGSLGVESSAGIHLRWSLLKALGDKHLPKGNHPITKIHFNKQDDFVHIYRIPYVKSQITFSLAATISPQYKDHANARWRYVVPGLGKVDVWFRDKTKYNSIGINTATAAFLTAYTNAIMEIELVETLAFSVEFNLSVSGNYTLEAETLSAEANLPLSPKTITARQGFNQSSVGTKRMVAEHLRSVRFKLSAGSVTSLSFEVYDDHLSKAQQNGSIEFVESFSLTMDDNTAYKRLEESGRFQVNHLWKKFNEDAFVNVGNYQKRWFKSGGLKQGVDRYLALSNVMGNPTAIDTITDYPDSIVPVQVSYLDMLLIAATDYHVARMIGLGHVDTPSGNNETTYLYLAEYHTAGDLEDGKGARPVQHLYLSLPTARKDQRFPEEVVVDKITYGLNDQGDVALTDSSGYTPDGQKRFINIFTRLKTNPVTGDAFFVPNILFQAADYTPAIFCGMEYRKKSETNWRKPEIAHHTELTNPNDPNSPKLYQDTKAIAETAVLLLYDTPNKPSLIHREMEAGFHEYAAYPINILSRSGEPALTPTQTDETKFVKKNTLLPPTDLRVQLIQKEDPLILTSANEQTMLTSLGADKTLVRLTFNYGYAQDTNYDFGDQFEVFFRQEMPEQVMGKIAVVAPNGTDRSHIDGANYTFGSTNETVSPAIPSAKIPKYIDGAFVHNGKRYFIKGITDLGADMPKFELQNLEERTVITNGNQQVITVAPVPFPSTDLDKQPPFVAIENMANAANWGANNPLSCKINIDKNQWTIQSEVKDSENTVQVRGIWAKAKITIENLTTSYTDEFGVVHSQTTNNHHYKIEFDTFALSLYNPTTTNPAGFFKKPVEWYNGIVRIPLAVDGQMKQLNVFQIEQMSPKLILLAGDSTLVPGEFPSTLVDVNFYPGYRAYLIAENPKGFNQAAILPASGTNFKNTLIGMRTVDTVKSYTSHVSVPAILMAQELTEPGKPELPIGPDYATPPDTYNKSTYTFTTKFTQDPFAVVVYRADINALLNALYESTPSTNAVTPNKIKEQLDAMQPDKYWVNRWKDMVNPSGSSFQSFPKSGGGTYAFPTPDKLIPLPPVSTFAKDVLNTICNVFVPVTKQPMLLKDIITNSTINQKTPATWNPATKTLTFTDFTIDGGMNTSYFYFVRDMSSRMQLGDASPIRGPIQLVNTKPPSAPVISKVTSRMADIALSLTPAIRFDILVPPASEKVTKIHIFRTTKSEDAIHLRTMQQPVLEVDISTLTNNNGILSIYDDFTGIEVPFGDPLYYRLVFVRKVDYKDMNDLGDILWIPSISSKLCLSNIMDSVNPEPPVITFTKIQSSGNEFSNIVLSWHKTTYKGKYFLFKMSSSGQWSKIKTIDNQQNIALVSVPLLQTDLLSDKLTVINDDNENIYHHFKVGVESTSGLLNLYDKILTIGSI
jgi:hypothetical protein